MAHQCFSNISTMTIPLKAMAKSNMVLASTSQLVTKGPLIIQVKSLELQITMFTLLKYPI